MSFFVLHENPVQSANMLCWLDCESAAFDGARIIVSAIKKGGEQIDDLPFEPLDNHPLVKWVVVSKENARWLYRNTRDASIKWGAEHKMAGYADLMERLNKIASVIDRRIEGIAETQTTLFGNIYIDEEVDVLESVESNRAYYERTRKHLTWADHDPTLYGEEEE